MRIKLVISIVIFLPLFLILSVYTHLKKWSDLDQLEERVHIQAARVKMHREKREAESSYLRALASSTPNYIHDEIETMPLLVTEQAKLAAHCVHKDVPTYIRKRLDYLTSGANQFKLEVKDVRSEKSLTESEVVQESFVELDLEDLHSLLFKLESNRFHRPDIFIKRFELKRANGCYDGENYAVRFELIHREQKETP